MSNLMEHTIKDINPSLLNIIPSIDQRRSQIELLNSMDKERNSSREFLFPEENSLRRRRSSIEFPVVQSDDEDEAFESFMIIEFDKNVNRRTLHWIVDKIRSKKVEGGSQLLIKKEPAVNHEKGLTLHVSATRLRLLEIADEIGYMKPTKDGMRSFNIGCLDDFIYEESMIVDDILSASDKQLIIKHALDTIKAQESEKKFPGQDHAELYHGQSIIQAALYEEFIINMYSLHDKEFLKKMGPTWYKSYKHQPVDLIRNYFGESIAMYFSFVGFYTFALMVPTIFGIFQFLFAGVTTPFFCVFYVLWMTMFLEIWKRKSSELAFKWGTITMTNLDTPRPDYYGTLGKDPITGKLTPQYPMYKTHLQIYFVSVPVIFICILGSAYMTIIQFYFEDSLMEKFGADSYIVLLPSIFQSVFVAVLAVFYEKFATWLTLKENHRTQSQYERHRVNKLIVLEFVNNFLCLFYIAFIKMDMKMLRSQLMTQMIVLQFVQNAQEFLVPIIKIKLMKWWYGDGHQKSGSDKSDSDSLLSLYDDLNIKDLEADDPTIKQNKKESIKDDYNTYDDYLELYIQFGYVVLFSSVAPLAAFWAFLNNILEIRLDAYKLCISYRRPFGRRAKNIGAWQLAFEVLAVMSIMTNCGILYLSPQVSLITEGFSNELKLVIFVLLEHFLLAMVWFIHKAIPDRPRWVRIALAKGDYVSGQALKRED